MVTSSSNRAAVILAGGDGNRLSEYIRSSGGLSVPKQFFAPGGGLSMLERTRRRVARCVSPSRTFFALSSAHRFLFSPILVNVPSENQIIQPENRGTAPAILYSALRIAQAAPHSSVLLMPSDHHVEDESALTEYIEQAFETVEHRPELTVLLGAQPREPDCSYGWLEPGARLSESIHEVRRVRRFVEKPAHDIAVRLMRTGCLWNTFIVISRVSTLLALYLVAMPELYFSFSRIRLHLSTTSESKMIGRIFTGLRSSDFSRDVLQAALNLCVLKMSEIGWSDIGEPRRLRKIFGADDHTIER
jgi:mannose-1-phosphate guanylyltransferase